MSPKGGHLKCTPEAKAGRGAALTLLYILIWKTPKIEGGNNTRREKTYTQANTNTHPHTVCPSKERQGHPMQTDKEERTEASQIHLVLRRSRCVEEGTGGKTETWLEH